MNSIPPLIRGQCGHADLTYNNLDDGGCYNDYVVFNGSMLCFDYFLLEITERTEKRSLR